MFTFTILIGIYSYIIFALGLMSILYKQNIIIATVIFIVVLTYFYKKKIKQVLFNYLINVRKYRLSKCAILFLGLIVAQALVNFIGTLGPELAFDALWYHLTLPKIYLINHEIIHLPGNLLYYSDMPKLTEMIYTAAIAFGNELNAKVIHFMFGILSTVAIYRLSGKFFGQKLSLIAALVFYSNLVVAWESTTAYVDLSRTFFEIMALSGFVNWWRKRELKWLIESAVMLGLALSTKLLALGPLLIISTLIFYKFISRNDKNIFNFFSSLSLYWLVCLLVATPWFVFSFIYTGNPIYPFFSDVYKFTFNTNILAPQTFVRDLWQIFIHADDPISPLYVIFFPIVIIFFRKFKREVKLISIYSLLALVIWYFTPRTGGGRFIMVYLPAFSIVIAAAIEQLKKQRFLYKLSIILVILVSLTSIIYRGIANAKYLPVIFGGETKEHFLTRSLNFSFGDFYDTDNYFKTHVNESDMVLLYGFHNLYYIDFPFIDSSWIRKGDKFNYIAVQNNALPQRFEYWNFIYHNPLTHVYLYSLGGQKWVY